MKIPASAVVIGLVILFTPPATAMTTDNCIAMWNKADTNNDGVVAGRETKPYVVAMTDAEMKPSKLEIISSTEFMKACETGAFRLMTM